MLTRILRGTGTVFIVTGLLLLYFVVYELVGTSLQTRAHQSELRQAFAEVLDDPQVVPSGSPAPSASPAPAKRTSRVPAIARIEIPRIGVDAIVVEGVSLSRLAYGPGHYPDSARIGSPGSAAIAGHRTGWGSPFINLDKLRSGDDIVLTTASGTFTYRVTKGRVVGPSDYWVVDGDPDSTARAKLALTTCTPKYTSRNRLVVWADLVKTTPPVAA